LDYEVLKSHKTNIYACLKVWTLEYMKMLFKKKNTKKLKTTENSSDSRMV
jgi:hypothetical protein